MKRFARCLGLLLLAAAVLLIPAPLARAVSETLTIKGDGVERELTYSRAELEAITPVRERHTYSLANNFPTEKTEYAAGISLSYLLEQAGLKDTARLLTFTASDGYKREFTVEELLYAPRYYFPKEGEKQPVPALICLQSSANGFEGLNDTEFKLIMGQRAKGEQTNPWFVKNLSLIEVSCEKPEQWPQVTFDRVSGPDGVTLQLSHENINAV
ncbi:MAG: hypothetical protein FWG06_04630, partial [Clostridiales bacterium]|nr:hypothetical protein [Clostridiales bacterium]